MICTKYDLFYHFTNAPYGPSLSSRRSYHPALRRTLHDLAMLVLRSLNAIIKSRVGIDPGAAHRKNVSSHRLGCKSVPVMSG